MRADSLRQTDNLSRLHDRFTEAERKVALHEAEEAALRSQLKASEATIQKLKEEAARAKKLVAETRAACANEVRKRDRQIDGLKKAVTDAGRARGERKGNTITTIQVAGEIGAEDVNAGASTMDEGYNLRHETNGFLAQLAKSLSEENEALLGLVRKTGDSLKDMSGWDKQQDATGKKGDSSAVVLATSPEDMAADMTSVLEHLRTLLTNPSFVPLEEVVVREEEIFRLRDGWEKMETRWRDAVHLIDSWRRRMAAGGHPVDMEDLKMGLRLSPVRIQNMEQIGENDPFQLSTLQEEEEEDQGQGQIDEDDEEEDEDYAQEEEQMDFKPAERPSREGSLHLVPAPGYEDMVPEYEEPQDDVDHSDAESSIFQDDVEDIDMDELQASEPNIEILHHSTGLQDDTNSTTLPPPPKITPLEETAISGNRKPAARLTEKSKKRSSELMRDTSTEDAKAPPPPPPHRVKEGESPQKRLKVSAEGQNDKPKSRPNSAIFTDPGSSLGSDLQAKATPESSVSKASSKTTVKSVRSDVSAKKDTPTQSKPSTRATRAAQAQAQEKKETPTRAITRQKSTRAIAATNASSARSAASRQETTKARAPPAPTSSRAEMPPPPRPSKSTPSNEKTLRPPPSQNDEKKPSPREKPQPASVNTSAPIEPSSSSSAKRPAPESPTRSPGKAGSSRLPLPRNVAPPPQQSPLTMARIAAKLAASEREADAARVRAKLRAARLNKGGGSAPSTAGASSTSTVASSRVASGESAPGDPVKKDRAVSGESAATGMSGSGASFSTDENGLRGGVSVLGGAGDDNDNDESASSSLTAAAPGPIARDRSPRGGAAPSSPRKATGATSPTKASAAAAAASAAASPAKPGTRKREVRSRAAKAANRRRSTLSPWELQSLIAGEVVPPTPSVQVVAPQQGEGE